ncbi:Prolyl carboxy peptidase like protein 5 [Aphelenchoides bicaudatus]|nr:Prolyl carboxy peptidase like protein 5 [Aphelenchoides bicaudatus]
MSILTAGLFLLLAVASVEALPRAGNLFYKSPVKFTDQGHYSWTEEWLESVPIDHFSYADHRTFELRYFINLDHYTAGGPIFFYTGNEGALEAFTVNTGLMWDLAPEYKAALVFVEHRYYGKTLPFGNESFSDIRNLGFLSSEQALADFAMAITYFKNERISDAKHSPVIAFGGSYGGMLSAWARVKYPHLFDGFVLFINLYYNDLLVQLLLRRLFSGLRHAGVAQDAYAHIVTRTFKLSGCSLKALLNSFSAIHEVAKTQEGIDYINEVLRLEEESKIINLGDSSYLVQAATDIMENVAMVDYPYEANFLQKLPAWPVKEMCKAFASSAQRDVKEQVKSLHSIFNVWYNTSGDVKEFCLRGKCAGGDDALGAMQGWTWQTCTEMVMPICHSGPPNDVFKKDCPYTVEGYLDFCSHNYKDINYDHELMRPDWILENFGREFPTASNIVFSNGYLDPWSAGGWSLVPKTEGSLVSLIIETGAHHYDLRASHPNDTKEGYRGPKN